MEPLDDQPCVRLVLDDPHLQQCHVVTVPGRTEQEGWDFLRQLDGAVAGAGTRQFLAGATWAPIRQRYQAVDRALAEAAMARLDQLGPNPSTEALEALVRQASGQRTRAARVWRLASGPDAWLAAEARDWAKYGKGGRTFSNLMARSEANAARASWSRPDHLRQVLRTVEKTNATVDQAVLRSARHLRRGGGVLAIGGLGWTAYEYSQTPTAQRAEFVKREGAAFAGSALASGLATAVLVTMSVSGVVLIGVGLVAGVAGGLAGEGLYRAVSGRSLLTQLGERGVMPANLMERFR